MKQTLARMEKQFINEALRQTNWHQAKAAKILGMPEPTLARKISLFKLKKPRKL
jgi:DNA-binding NtrC family response regulator